MSKTVKGILALVAAVILLAAGYGTYAQWTDSSVIGGGQITAGQLKLSGTDPCVWRDASAGSPGTEIANITTFRVVPGDIITCTLTRTVLAEGANLSATLAADPTSVTGSTELLAAMQNQITTAITVNGAAATAITPANNNQTVVATVRFNFPFSLTNVTQLQSLNLANLRLTLTQNPR